MSEYLVPFEDAESEFTEKRSRFISHIWRVETEAEARARIEEMKKRYYDARHNCWCYLIRQGGVVYGAFLAGQLKGFVSVEGPPMGSRGQYRDLTSLHVSEELRGRGIGRRLFTFAADWAKNQGAERLYLSSHSAVETQAFYQAMGCREAEEYNREHVEKEPFDCQLEYLLQ
ncbi:YigZ family protein [uncultured Oscillibacter sp.]|uniref:YigZ family protein n=1 Tax=uncultured Oscillibacter sp. TaxID=876091 RepID=UPI0025F343BC|nr:YigZ family protein [uncultured Oscillibacter sp.]